MYIVVLMLGDCQCRGVLEVVEGQCVAILKLVAQLFQLFHLGLVPLFSTPPPL